MRMNDILNEAIVENGTGLVAYCIVVAEEYAKLPMVDKSKVPLWFDLVAHNSKMADKILSKLDVEFTEEDPYKTQKEMLYDIVINKKLKIFKSKDASLVISDEENNIGRVVHDYLGHYLPNHKAFVELVSKNAVTSKAYSEFRFKSHSFTVRGELSTYLTHSKLLSNVI